MTELELNALVRAQRDYFASGATQSRHARLDALDRLENAIQTHENALYAALRADLGKSEMESDMCELGLVRSEIRWMKKHLKKLMKNRRARTPLAQAVGKSYQSPSPYGTVLIMSPWNYPVLLTLEPLVDALAAGNTAIVKPSAYAPASSEALRQLLEDTFPKELVCVVTGGRAENQALLNQQFDKIFFTGSPAVGREVMGCASAHLTPVTLELGGKSPCIVDKTAKIDLAARRIVFGKFINCGQTCVAPDYILCHESIRLALLSAIAKEIQAQFGEHPLANPDYGKIVNQKHFNRLFRLIDHEKVAFGGESDESACRIAPTVLTNVCWSDPIMQEEIFGPLLPVLTYKNLNEALGIIESRPRPLALYCFTESKAVKTQVLSRCRFGGGCINDTLIHLASSELPFGGVGESGMGSYHGEAGFREFSHLRSVVDKATWVDMPVRYQPYNRKKRSLIQRLLKISP